MTGLLFSLNFFCIALVILALSTAVAYLCVFLRQHSLYIPLAEWLTLHTVCPLSKMTLLLFFVFLLFPLLFENVLYRQLFGAFLQLDLILDLINILLFSSVLISFLPTLIQTALGMPVLACIATALLYQHQIVIPASIDFRWFPSGSVVGQLAIIIILALWSKNWLQNKVAQWIDLRFMINDSKNLLVEINYLIFQVPVVLVYAQSL